MPKTEVEMKRCEACTTPTSKICGAADCQLSFCSLICQRKISYHTPTCAANIQANLSVIRQQQQQQQEVSAQTTNTAADAVAVATTTDVESEDVGVKIAGKRITGFSFDNDVEGLFTALSNFGVNFKMVGEAPKPDVKRPRIRVGGLGLSNLVKFISEAGSGMTKTAQQISNFAAGLRKIPGDKAQKAAILQIEVELFAMFQTFVEFATKPEASSGEAFFKGQASKVIPAVEVLLGKTAGATGIGGKWFDAVEALIANVRAPHGDKASLARLKIAARMAGRDIDNEVKGVIALHKAAKK